MKNVGSLSLYRGEINNLTVRMWDAIPLCDANCPLWEEQCPYDKSEQRCQLRRVYVESVFSSLNKAIKEKDEMTMHRIGLLLMPLYTSLISIKLEVYNKKGKVRGVKGVDPIYKEMRETIKLIDHMLRDLGVDKGKGGSGDSGNGDLLNGDSGYYDSLIEDGHVPA